MKNKIPLLTYEDRKRIIKPLRNVCFCHPKDLKFFKKYLSNGNSEPLIFKTSTILLEGVAKVIDFKKNEIYTFVPSLNPKLGNKNKKN